MKEVDPVKTSIKILALAVALVVMNGCSAQKRAQRQVRRAVEKCPELVQVKAHLIDTALTAPAFADVATVPMDAVASFDTIYAATPHGTVVVSMSQSDSSLRVGFVAAPQQIHYQDTINYAQVVVTPLESVKQKKEPWEIFSYGFGVAVALAVCLYIIRRNS